MATTGPTQGQATGPTKNPLANHDVDAMPQVQFELLKLLVYRAEQEANRMWSTFTIMITVNVALAVIAFLLEAPYQPSGALLCSVLGMIVSIVWTTMMRQHKSNERRWLADAQMIVDRYPSLSSIVMGPDSPQHYTRSPLLEYAFVAPWVFISVWVVVFGVSFVTIAPVAWG